jgi:hypothetical protein
VKQAEACGFFAATYLERFSKEISVQCTLTPALSHPMGEGERLNASILIGDVPLYDDGELFPSPVGRERARVRVALSEIQFENDSS